MMTDMGGQRKRKKDMYYGGGTMEAPYEIYENLRQDQPVTLILANIKLQQALSFCCWDHHSNIKYRQPDCLLAEKGEKGGAVQFED